MGHLVAEEINRIPTAYDPDKVVEQLESAKNKAAADYHNCSGDMVTVSYGEMTAYQKAIGIVKEGEENEKDN